eukprot:SAG31_NODE_3913_length_3756_cov_1.959256_6_plen_98_part_00
MPQGCRWARFAEQIQSQGERFCILGHTNRGFCAFGNSVRGCGDNVKNAATDHFGGGRHCTPLGWLLNSREERITARYDTRTYIKLIWTNHAFNIFYR